MVDLVTWLNEHHDQLDALAVQHGKTLQRIGHLMALFCRFKISFSNRQWGVVEHSPAAGPVLAGLVALFNHLPSLGQLFRLEGLQDTLLWLLPNAPRIRLTDQNELIVPATFSTLSFSSQDFADALRPLLPHLFSSSS
jgi:hypothetical protein